MIIKQLKFTKTVQREDEPSIELKYYLVLNISVREYGIAVHAACGDRRERIRYTAITPDCSRAEALLQALADGSVTPVTVPDVVQDWLAD